MAVMPPLRPVRRMSDQVADQLRDLIVGGQLAPGARLPREEELAQRLGVSRSTLREALRTLAAERLVRTAKGASGGTFVSVPSVDQLSELVRSSLTLLSATETVTLDELLEARELIEVPVVRLAACRCDAKGLERLRLAIPGELTELATRQQFEFNREFHGVVLDLCGNTLLALAAQPLFRVLQTRLAREALGARFHRSIADDHRRISAAVAASDPDAAEEEMRRHLAFLRPAYERVWRRGVSVPSA